MTTETEPAAMIVSISGRVQGVAFRAWTKTQADSRGLGGWVRNEADGTVSAQIEGDPTAVASMLRAFHIGPRAAQVDRVTALPGAATDATAFRIIDDGS